METCHQSWRNRWIVCRFCCCPYRGPGVFLNHKKECKKDKEKTLQQGDPRSFQRVEENDQNQHTDYIKHAEHTDERVPDHGNNKKDTYIFRCNLCSKTFVNKKNLRDHFRRHNGEKKFQCNLCNQRFFKPTDLKRHASVHTGEKPFQCSSCGASFGGKSDLRRHQKRIASCMFSLLTHESKLNSTDQEKSNEFNCSFRNEGFFRQDQETQLQLTLERRHEDCEAYQKLYKCEFCSKHFLQLCDLTRHSLVHTGGGPAECQMCYKVLANKTHLTEHQQIHSDTQAYQCNVCKEQVLSLCDLKRHSKAREETIMCNICSKVLNSKGIREHLRRHEGDRPYQCNFCRTRFYKRSELQRHIVIHTGERPFKCEICLKCFSHRKTLREHRLTHSDFKPYECEVCSKRFRRQHDMKRHLMEQHRKSLGATETL